MTHRRELGEKQPVTTGLNQNKTRKYVRWTEQRQRFRDRRKGSKWKREGGEKKWKEERERETVDWENDW